MNDRPVKLTRHADHDPLLICRPALGYGLREVLTCRIDWRALDLEPPDELDPPAGECPTLGDYPGQFSIAPGGRFLFACNKRSDCITGFRIDADGMLTPTGQYTGVGSAASITFPGRARARRQG